jgi:hypothetical protein
MAFPPAHAHPGMQHPGMPHGQPMGPGQVHHPGQAMGQPMMHPQGPGGPMVTQGGPMMAGMQPSMGGPGGPNTHANMHLMQQANMQQQRKSAISLFAFLWMTFGNQSCCTLCARV